jgi:ABC-2 type transport system permease protein
MLRGRVPEQVVERQAPLFAALIVTLGANLALGAIAAASLVAYGLPVAGSVAFGLSWAVFGWAFAAIAQATEGTRAARGISIAVLGLCLVLRMAGDVGKEDGPSWISWLTLFGWIQHIHLYGDQRWWVFVLFAGVMAAFVASALALSARRDLQRPS